MVNIFHHENRLAFFHFFLYVWDKDFIVICLICNHNKVIFEDHTVTASTSWGVDNNFNFSEDPETQKLLSRFMGLLHNLHNSLNHVLQLLTTISWTGNNHFTHINMYLHQSSSLPGKHLRFHKSAGPLWFFQARLYALVEPQPEKQRRQTHKKMVKIPKRKKYTFIYIFVFT